ncbi:hypothetical protein TorRG33x02_251640 [Trema orientale]|uniref:Transmembrane protein n=1 Tax=Trema orientale TaxID=63057 RepID=A0A2P5DH14_TREOI|nr:hypothetical protein TorRG33x02_251640 [Trema orientale]
MTFHVIYAYFTNFYLGEHTDQNIHIMMHILPNFSCLIVWFVREREKKKKKEKKNQVIAKFSLILLFYCPNFGEKRRRLLIGIRHLHEQEKDSSDLEEKRSSVV